MPGDMSDAELFGRGPVAVFKWRNEPGWPVEFVSANVAETFGHTPEDFLTGRVCYANLVHPDDLDRVTAEVGAALDGGLESFEHAPYRIIRPDGSTRWLYDTTYLVETAGEITHFLGYVVNITARVEAQEDARSLERRLLQAQRLESLGVLAGGIAHDFNNILTGILGEAGISRLALASGEDPRPSIENIEELALRAADLTRQLLAYSGKGRLVVIPIDLTDVIEDMTKMLTVVISNDIALDLRLAAVLPAIDGDRAQLQQIVMNLITNASDAFGEERGLIRVETGYEEFDTAALKGMMGAEGLESGRYVTLSVTDTGCGMTEDVRAHIFEPFFTTKATGRGLGMSAILGIMRSHGGAISVTSTPGEGTSFRLLFPPSAQVAVPFGKAPIAAEWEGQGVALVVDDEPSVRRVAGRMLSAIGFEPVTAADGDEALELYRARREEITLVVLDVMMPRMGGEETLRELRRLDPSLPIIISSGFDEEEVTTRLARASHTTFLQKPYLLEHMRSAARTVLEGV